MRTDRRASERLDHRGAGCRPTRSRRTGGPRAVTSTRWQSLTAIAVLMLLAVLSGLTDPDPVAAVSGLSGGWWAVDLHAHTVFSSDAQGDLGIESRNARAAGLDAVFLTDHNLASEFQISGHTANHAFFADNLTRWTPATFGGPTSSTVALATSPVHSGSASIHIVNKGGSGSESMLWSKRGANFLPNTGSSTTKLSVYPVTSLAAGSSLYVSATVGGDASVEAGAPVGYTPAESGVATPCKSVVLVWYFGSAPSTGRFAPTSTSKCGSNLPAPVVREFPIPAQACDKAFTTGTWVTCSIDVSAALSDLWSTNPGDRPYDYNALSDLKMAASGDAEAYFDDYATDKGPLPGTALSRAGDEFALRDSLLAQYSTPGQFMLFPSLEAGQSQHAQRFNFPIADSSQFTTSCAPSPSCSYSLGVDSIMPTEISGYPGQLNHPGVGGGVSDAQATTNGTNGYAYGADVMEVRDQNMMNDWDTILKAGQPLVGDWTTDDHSSTWGTGSPVTFLQAPSLTFDALMQALFEGRAFDATLSIGRAGRFVINLDGSTTAYPARFPDYVSDSGTGPTVVVKQGGGLSSGSVVRWIVNGAVAFSDATSSGKYSGSHQIPLGGGSTAYARAEVRTSSAKLRATTEPIMFRTVGGLPAGLSYHVETVAAPSGSAALTRKYTQGITSTSWNAASEALLMTLTDTPGSLADVRVLGAATAPNGITVDGSPVDAAPDLAGYEAATTSSWFYDASTLKVYLKVLHATGDAGVVVAFGASGNVAPTAKPVSLAATTQTAATWQPIVSDANSDPLSCTIVTQPANGTAAVASDCSSGTYISSDGFSGADSFTYGVSDGSLSSDPATVSVDVGAPSAGNPIALVQQAAAGGSSSTLTVALPAASSNGDALVAEVAIAAGSSASVTTIADTAGGTWTKGPVGYLSGTNSRVETWYRLGASSISSATITLSASKRVSANLSEWSGVATAAAVDASGSGSGASSTTVVTPSLSTSNASDVVIGAVNYPAAAVSTLTTGSATGLADFDSGTSVHGRAAYFLTSGTGSFQTSWSLSALSGGNGGSMLALKAAG